MGNRILVIGSAGKTGKRVFERLENLKEDVVGASRSTVVPFDWYDQSTWAKALININKVYITFQPDIAIPQAPAIIRAFVGAAKNAGVTKLVLLSGRGEVEAQVCEDIVIASGLEYTIIRCSFFMQNFSEGIWLDAINGGEFVVPKVKAREPFVDTDDIADVVVTSLLNDKHNGKIYELTGPELLSFQDVILRVSQGVGKPIKFTEVRLDEYASVLRSYKIPEDVVSLITYLFGQVLDGRNESVADSIPKVLGRGATSFQDYVAKAARQGAWRVN